MPGELSSVPFVLMYHSVDGRQYDPYGVTVSPTRFAEQMRWLRRQGLCGASVRQLLAAPGHGWPAGLVGLTFDDGYRDFAAGVLPVLAEYGFGATVFVLAGKLGGCNDWDERGPVKPLMTVDQVRHAARHGVEIGSHGLYHQDLARVDPDVLGTELRRSRHILESIIEAPVDGFCYPYGRLSDDTTAAARLAGYDYAVATWEYGRRDRYALPRTYIGERDGATRLHAKRLRHRFAWGAPRPDTTASRAPGSIGSPESLHDPPHPGDVRSAGAADPAESDR